MKNLKLTDEMLLSYIKSNVKSSHIFPITSNYRIEKKHNIKAHLNSFNKISLLHEHVNIYFEDDFRYKFMSYLYNKNDSDKKDSNKDIVNKENINKHEMDNGFVNYILESHFLELVKYNISEVESTSLNNKIHEEIVKISVLSKDVYIEVKRVFFERVLQNEFGVNTKSRVNEKLVKSISNKKPIDINIGLLEQSFNMNTILNLKVGEVIKTNRKKKEGLQILYQENILANNIFVSKSNSSKIIIGQ